MKLESLSIKIEQQCKPFESADLMDYYSTRDTILESIEKYANFLKQTLTLGDFVECDLEGNVLEKPNNYHKWASYVDEGLELYFSNEKECLAYQQAQERVLFKGNWEHSTDCRYTHMNWCQSDKCIVEMHKHNTVEDLIYKNLELTPNAIKQLK